MRKTVMVLGVLLFMTLLVNPAIACDGKDAKQASIDGASCPLANAKAAYAETLEKTGCEKKAQAAYKNTLAETAYAESYAENGCSKKAQQAAYDAVYSETNCSKSATAAATHALAKAAYDKTLAETGSEESAQAAYASITTTAGASCNRAKCDKSASGASCDKAKCDKGAAQTASEESVNTDVKLASKDSK